MNGETRMTSRSIGFQIGLALLVAGSLYACSLESYLLFHSLVETFTIAVAVNLFILAWNTRFFLRFDYLKVLGVCYGAISLVDLLHTLAFKGMGVFPENDTNLATQLWIAARYLQAAVLCWAPVFARRTISDRILVPVAFVGVALPVVAIFLGWFPVCYVEGSGLTPFKILSEYVIIGLFLLAIGWLWLNRKAFGKRIFSLVVASIGLTILSELAFTSYVSVYSQANLVGHFLKLAAFYFLYRALIDVGFKEPYELIFRDLRESERALGETVLERTEKLRVSEARFRAVFEQSPLGKAVVGLDGRLQEVNQAFARMMGTTSDRLTGRNFAEFTHPDDAALSRAKQEQVLAGDGHPIQFEKRYVTDDGTVVWAEVTTTLVRDEAAQPLYLITAINDITGRKKIEAEQERLQAQLNQSQKMEAVGLLAGGVAHDFNNMLGVILGRVQLAETLVHPGGPVRIQLEQIRKAGERSADLTRQLLAFARKQPIAPRVLDLNTVLEASLEMLRRLIGEDLEMVWNPGKGVLPVRIDPSQVDQVVTNLCVNSRDAAKGPGTITLATRLERVDEAFCQARGEGRPGTYTVLSVADNGVGMSPETMARIFEPFYTTKELGKGTGLGLSIVYGILQQNEGFVTVESAVGRGTTFELYFPSVTGQSEDREPHRRPKGTTVGQETILLVEDEPMLLEVLGTMLTGLGFTVLGVPGAEEALKVAQGTERIDLLVTDVIMPKMNGKELADRLQARNPGLRVLFMSGYTAAIASRQGGVEGEFLQKPFTVDDFATKLREVLGR